MTNDEIADVAEAVGHVFLIPGTWTQGTYARDKHGHSCWPYSKSACAWNLWGAVEECIADADYQRVHYFFDAFERWHTSPSSAAWNDAPGQTAENVANELFNFADAMRTKVAREMKFLVFDAMFKAALMAQHKRAQSKRDTVVLEGQGISSHRAKGKA